MQSLRRVIFLAALLLVVSGCGGGGDEGKRVTANVSGAITMGGQPLVGAEVYFMSSDGGFTGFGTTDANGQYTLVQGAALGSNTIFISKKTGEIPAEYQGDPESGMDMGQFEAMAMGSTAPGGSQIELPEETIPPEFSDPKLSKLKWDVVEGTNEGVNFNL